MAPSFCIDLGETEKLRLLEIARQSIESGLNGGNMLRLDGQQLNGMLAAQLGTFVTLTRNEELRGCMGTLESSDPLAHTVVSCAFNAAFRDPRFAQLNTSEMADTRIEISVLSQMEPFAVTDRENLLSQLRPHVDGLLLEDGHYRSTFLPKVWEKIGAPREFLQQLLIKAGLSFDYWSETIRFQRYQTISFGEMDFFPVHGPE
ncbi:MAG: AmmeMemoRadiSam system protein A [Gammaproteobacteria bacterium]|nr:AmmeMemoRadiSam system protein A [Gammaproteobacteria bacterium]